MSKTWKKIKRKFDDLRALVSLGRFAVLYVTILLVVVVLGVILFVQPTLLRHKGWVGIQVRHDINSSTLVIEQVLPDSPAELVGLQPGDKVLAYNGTPVTDISILKELIRGSYIRQLVRIAIERNGKAMYADVRIVHIPENVTVLPPIVPIYQGTPRPHPDRGTCTDCHTLLPPRPI